MSRVSSDEHTRPGRHAVSALQEVGWAAWNDSYHDADPQACRVLGRALYEQDIEERISALFAHLDKQNMLLDALSEQES